MSDKTCKVLLGKTVLVTRPKDQADSLLLPLVTLGADVLLQPVIEIVSRTDESIATDLGKVGFSFDRIIFSSANGVRSFCGFMIGERNRSEQRSGYSEKSAFFENIRNGTIRLAAMGTGTAKALEEFGLTADLVPADFRAEGMLEALQNEGIGGRRFLSIRGSRGRSVLRDGICERGGESVELSVYESRDLTLPDPEIQRQLDAGSIDAVTVTSSAIAISLIRMFGESLRKTSLFSISSLTSGALREKGFEPAGQAAYAVMEDLAGCIADFFR